LIRFVLTGHGLICLGTDKKISDPVFFKVKFGSHILPGRLDHFIFKPGNTGGIGKFLYDVDGVHVPPVLIEPLFPFDAFECYPLTGLISREMNGLFLKIDLL
jgi:hypothetical protein